MSKCESNVNELIASDLVGIPGTVSSRLADFRDWRGDASADVSELEIAASDLEVCGPSITAIDFANPYARYSEVSFELGGDVVHARLIACRSRPSIRACAAMSDVSRHRPTRAGMASHDEVCGHGICRACAGR